MGLIYYFTTETSGHRRVFSVLGLAVLSLCYGSLGYGSVPRVSADDLITTSTVEVHESFSSETLSYKGEQIRIVIGGKTYINLDDAIDDLKVKGEGLDRTLEENAVSIFGTDELSQKDLFIKEKLIERWAVKMREAREQRLREHEARIRHMIRNR